MPASPRVGILNRSGRAIGLCARRTAAPCFLAPLHRLQDLVGAGELLGVRVPDLLHQLLRGAVTLRSRGDPFLVGREPHARQVLLEGRHVEVGEVAQVALAHAFVLPCFGSYATCSGSYLPAAPEPKTERSELALGPSSSCPYSPECVE